MSEITPGVVCVYVFPNTVRLFKPVVQGRAQLARTGKTIEAGTKLLLSDLILMFYDHRHKIAAKVENDSPEEYILVEEVDDEVRQLCKQWERKSQEDPRRVEVNVIEDLMEISVKIKGSIRKYGRADLKIV